MSDILLFRPSQSLKLYMNLASLGVGVGSVEVHTAGWSMSTSLSKIGPST